MTKIAVRATRNDVEVPSPSSARVALTFCDLSSFKRDQNNREGREEDKEFATDNGSRAAPAKFGHGYRLDFSTVFTLLAACLSMIR